MSLRNRIKHLLWTSRRERAYQELSDELENHLQLSIEEKIAEGCSSEEARRAASLEFGGRDRWLEECRDSWRWNGEWLFQDLRSGWLRARRSLWTSLLIILLLGVGIGVTTTLFSIVREVLLRPLPYPESSRLVMFWDYHPELALQEGPSPGNLLDWRRLSSAFDGIGAWYAGDPSILEGDFETTQITTAKVTSDFFRVLQVEAALGRTFGEQEIDDQAQVVVISHDLWRRRFGSDPEVVGSQLQIDRTAREIIGVMPPRFRIPNREVGLWIPWNLVAEYARLGGVPRDYRFLRVVGRLATDQSIDSARSEMAGLARRLESFPENQGWTVRLAPFQAHLLERFQSPLLILLVAVLLVLSITSLNVANIQLSRMSVRTPELALRAVLGSPPGRLLSQSLMENLVLVVAGGGMGIALAYLSLAPVLRLAPPGSSLSRSDSD